jgi:hypothetical protein
MRSPLVIPHEDQSEAIVTFLEHCARGLSGDLSYVSIRDYATNNIVLVHQKPPFTSIKSRLRSLQCHLLSLEFCALTDNTTARTTCITHDVYFSGVLPQ